MGTRFALPIFEDHAGVLPATSDKTTKEDEMDLGHEGREGTVKCSYCGRAVKDFKTVLRESHRLLDHFGIEPLEAPEPKQQRV